MSQTRKHLAGFTLIEVLVALAIVAVALAAGLRASGALVNHAQRQTEQLLAQICAENELIRLRLTREIPPLGQNTVNCEQAGQQLAVSVQVSPTPNPNFRRVEARVLNPSQQPVLSLVTILGRL
jgi:general secretion pathway protein I